MHSSNENKQAQCKLGRMNWGMCVFHQDTNTLENAKTPMANKTLQGMAPLQPLTNSLAYQIQQHTEHTLIYYWNCDYDLHLWLFNPLFSPSTNKTWTTCNQQTKQTNKQQMTLHVCHYACPEPALKHANLKCSQASSMPSLLLIQVPGTIQHAYKCW